jgi:organic hydroperoxide reductase OsmC/OhrA
MMGTLALELAGKKIKTFEQVYRAEIEGDIENVNGTLKITRLRAHYALKAPEEQWDDARKALDTYLDKCPAAQSVIGCIDIRHDLTLEPIPE